MEQVSLWKCDAYDHDKLKTAIKNMLEPLGGICAFVSPGQRVLLKPNMLSAKRPEQAVTTHPLIVQVVAEMVRDCGCKVLIGDSPGIGSFASVTEKTGIARAASISGSELVKFDEMIELKGNDTFKLINVARTYWEADAIINLPKLKTHEMMTMTCAVKNLFGAVIGSEKAAWHLKAGSSRSLFARLLLDIYLLKKPVLNIVDAIVAMEGNGPGSGDPIVRNMLMAGANAVAVDSLAGKLAGIPEDLLPLQQEAIKMGLAGAQLSELEILGILPEQFDGTPFSLPTGLDVQFGLPAFLSNLLKHHLTTYPVVDKSTCVLCGACRDACPPAAISIKNSALIVDQRRCIRCWCCRELCPNHAMGVSHRSLVSSLLHCLMKKRQASSSSPRGISL